MEAMVFFSFSKNKKSHPRGDKTGKTIASIQYVNRFIKEKTKKESKEKRNGALNHYWCTRVMEQ